MTNPLVKPDRAGQNAGGNEVQVRRAREAAEALFKAKSPSSAEDTDAASIATPVTAEQPAPRQPRIIAVPPMAPPREEMPFVARDVPAATPQLPRRTRGSQTHKISASDHGRIRILATHGLTLDQVAELYGVPTRTIERIVGGVIPAQ